jgi:hemerythrin-like domain-containing protein
MKSTNALIQEHKVILRGLDILDAIAGSCESSGKVDEADVDHILEFLRWFADAHHQAKEETILFPALKSAATAEGRQVEHLMLEHNQERGLIESLEKDVRLGRLQEFVTCANRLSSTLRNHIYKEDTILFEAADSLLTPQQDDMCFEQLNRFETALDKRALDDRLRELHALEWKYLRK